MAAPFGNFRPDEGGFSAPAPHREPPLITYAALVWGSLMVVLAIVMLLFLVHLSRHQAKAFGLDGTIQPRVFWVPAPRSTERALVSREVGSVP